MKDFFEDFGYHLCENEIMDHWTIQAKYAKTVVSRHVCELNEKTTIFIKHYQWEVPDQCEMFTVSIIGQSNGLWWNVQAYSLTRAEIIKRLLEIENTLVQMFNATKP